MSEAMRRFERLAANARREQAPVGDVTVRVRAEIDARRAGRLAARRMLVLTGMYAAACAAVLVAAYLAAGTESDPIVSFFATAKGVTP